MSDEREPTVEELARLILDEVEQDLRVAQESHEDYPYASWFGHPGWMYAGRGWRDPSPDQEAKLFAAVELLRRGLQAPGGRDEGITD